LRHCLASGTSRARETHPHTTTSRPSVEPRAVCLPKGAAQTQWWPVSFGIVLGPFSTSRQSGLADVALVRCCGDRMEAQDEAKATKADKISAAEAAICFQLDNARTIHNKVALAPAAVSSYVASPDSGCGLLLCCQVRAFASWPGTWSLFQLEGDSEPQR
jgi:hypothetical protein